MAWNITQEPGYAEEVEADWAKRMKLLKFRTQHLTSLSRLPSEEVCSEFRRAAPFWGAERKSIERVEQFLFDLQLAGKFEAHVSCMKAWGEQVHQKPSTFHAFFKVQNLPRIVDRTGDSVNSNPLFSPDDSFEAINAYLAIDPLGCLNQPDLLSKSWVNGLAEESKRDAATVAMISAFYRYGDQRDRHAPQGEFPSGRTDKASMLLHLISESANKPFSEILRSFPAVKKASPALNRFYSELVDYRQGTSGSNYPQLISNMHAVMRSGGFFELAMQAKLFSTSAHSKVMEKGFRKDTDETYYNWVIASEFVSISEIKAILEPKYIQADHLKGLHEKGLAVPYLKSLDDDTLMEVIGRGIVVPKYLGRSRDRGKLLEADLGM